MPNAIRLTGLAAAFAQLIAEWRAEQSVQLERAFAQRIQPLLAQHGIQPGASVMLAPDPSTPGAWLLIDTGGAQSGGTSVGLALPAAPPNVDALLAGIREDRGIAAYDTHDGRPPSPFDDPSFVPGLPPPGQLVPPQPPPELQAAANGAGRVRRPVLDFGAGA